MLALLILSLISAVKIDIDRYSKTASEQTEFLLLEKQLKQTEFLLIDPGHGIPRIQAYS